MSNNYRCESKLQAALNMCFDSIIIIISLGKQSEQNCINVLDGYNVCVGKEEDLMLTGTWLVRLKLLAGLRFLPPALLPRLLLDALLAEFFLFLLLVVVCRVGSALHQTHKREDRCTHRKEVLIKHKCTHPHSQTCHNASACTWMKKKDFSNI